MGVITTAITLNPATWEGGNYSAVTDENIPINKGTGNTTYARVTYRTGRSATSHFFWKFDCSGLPDDAIIKTVTCSAKYNIAAANTNYVTTQNVNLYTAATPGSSGVGTAQTLVYGNPNVATIPGGSWTREQLVNGCYIGFFAQRATKNTTYNLWAQFYGAELEITYETNWVTSSATFTPDSNWGVVSTTGNWRVEGENYAIGKDTGNTSCAYIYTEYNRNESGMSFWGFDCSEIPDDVTIDSVTCSVKTFFSKTGNTANIGLYTNPNSQSSLKGSSVSVTGTTGSIYNIENTGTWTREELNNCYLGFYAKKNSTSSYPGNSVYFGFYGAVLTVVYSYPLIVYEVTVENNSVPASVYPIGTQEISEGEWGGFTMSSRFATIPLDITKIKITDNGNTLPLTSLTEHQATTSIDFAGTKLATFNSSSSSTSSLSENIENACDSIDSKSYAKLVGDSNSATNQYNYAYDFGNITIPQDATSVISVTLGIKAERYENSDWGAVVICNGVVTPLMISAITSGNSSGAPVATGSLYTMGYTEEVVSFPLTGMNISLGIFPMPSPEQGPGNPVLFLYGAYIEIQFFTSNGHTYTYYTYDNYPSEDHIYVIGDIGEIFYQRIANTWIESSWKSVYKKINNAWVQQETLEGVFQDDEVYFTGSTGDITTVQFGVNGILKQNDE